MFIFFRILICICLLSLISCAHIAAPRWIENRNSEYLRATSTPPLRIPPGVSSTSLKNFYPIPPTTSNVLPTTNISLIPPGLETH